MSSPPVARPTISLPVTMSDPLSISVITPSFNQATFIERTIQSVLGQDVAPLEYVVVDGLSTDETVQILTRYSDRLSFVSERDGGQADAVNRGIAKTSGAIIGWLNSDDVYYPGALAAVRGYFTRHPDVDVVYGNADHIDEHDRVLEPYPCEPWDPARLVENCYLCQPAVFFRRRVVARLGPLDTSLNFCMDYEFWLRLSSAGVRVAYLGRRLAGSRMYSANKTLSSRVRAHAETNDMLKKHLGTVPDRWLSNFAHVVLAQRGILRDHGRLRFALQASLLTWGAALRWNYALSPALKRLTWGWIKGETQAWRRDSPPAAASAPPRRPTHERSRLRIGLDISQTGTRKTGCGHLAASVVGALQNHGAPHDFLLYPTFGNAFWDPAGPGATWQPQRANFRRWPMPSTPGEARDFWRPGRPGLDAALGHPDIVQSFNFHCPQGLTAARIVYTLHDLAFLKEPDWTTEANRQTCFSGVFKASLYADLVVAMSEATRSHFLEMFPHYPAARTAVVPPPSRYADALPGPRPPACEQLTPGRFLLHVGTAEPRKNLERLIEAYTQYRNRATDPLVLALAGGKGWLMSGFDLRVRDLESRGHLVRLGYVEDVALQWLYQNCRTFVFPSLFEGFGLPVLEALSQGAAVITSRVSSLPEVGGDAVVYVDPTDADDIEAAIHRVTADAELWARLKREARRQAGRFSERATAEQTLAAYERVMTLGRYSGRPTLSPAVSVYGHLRPAQDERDEVTRVDHAGQGGTSQAVAGLPGA